MLDTDSSFYTVPGTCSMFAQQGCLILMMLSFAVPAPASWPASTCHKHHSVPSMLSPVCNWGPRTAHCSVCLLFLTFYYCSVSSETFYLPPGTYIFGCSALPWVQKGSIQNPALQEASSCIRRPAWLNEVLTAGLWHEGAAHRCWKQGQARQEELGSIAQMHRGDAREASASFEMWLARDISEQ